MRTRSLITGKDTGALYRLFVRHRRRIMTPPDLATSYGGVYACMLRSGTWAMSRTLLTADQELTVP